MSRFVLEGPVVLVPARVAAVLTRELNLAALREKAYRQRDRDVADVLVALLAVALRHEENAISGFDPTTTVPQPPQPDAESMAMGVISATRAAEMADCTPQAITKAARERRLHGTKASGAWWFQPDDVAAWAARRPA